MGRADEPCFHRSCRLDGHELLYEPLVTTAAKLTEGLGQHTVLLGAIGLVLTQATRVHHGKVRAQAVADGLIGSAHCMFESFQRQQDAEGHGGSTAGGAFGKACCKTVLDGGHESHPREGIGPWADGMGVRHKVSNL
jgi:hypothetical protein